MNTISKRFGDKVRALRKRRGLSQEEFADLSGFDRTYVSGIERGIRNPSLIAIEKIAIALEVSLSELFESLDEIK
ncbi:helix-turn-helix domain-containing protein [Herbaspirillum aquaticum]|uniref:Transcriptional regulator n=1 Tax=Herbaspirillum aquaticum TaxID=568783 RepID=A0A225SNU2_9BURK|nr:helix-turn-helix transcriptional regulator [Herbaspirillum aquaticum]OWY32669.1 transcriptional regulator [Herbaspirillum aquaticum]